ncbi:TraG family conjugative transposon ATPase, partial [Alistipes finegoldii]|uniref:TraG family conjugative transposon ATPase n=1 Tax=Alistipes finegoldii TaxID=214856 RepID=UPI00242BE01A
SRTVLRGEGSSNAPDLLDVFLDNAAETFQQFEKRTRNLQSLSRYSRANQINKEWLDQYLNEGHSRGLTPVRCHCNVVAWADDAEQLKRIKSDVGSQLATMECKPHHNTVDVPALFWAGIPGNESDFPAEESFYTYLEQALCFFTGETNYRDSTSPFGIKMIDRMTGKPLHLDIWDEPKKRGIIGNSNLFVVGPSGSGKSFMLNHLTRSYYEQGTHIVMVDTGNSYKGLCELIHQRTGGQDGVYYTYSEQDPISFNPFYVEDQVYDVEKRESIKTLILTLWKRDNEPPRRSEEVALSNAVSLYIQEIQKRDDLRPSFDTFYEFIDKEYRSLLESKRVREKDFDIENFLNVLEPYYKGGEYDYLLNSEKNIDLLNKRFIVFELDNIKDHPILLPVTTLIIMECFISKMRRLQGARKLIVIEEAWKALTTANMSQYIKYLFKTVRKFFGAVAVVTQEVDDIISSPIVKDTIINNSDTKILLDQRKYMNKFDGIQSLLGLTDKEKSQILSINLANDPGRKYKEVWIGLGGVQSAVYATEVSTAEYYTYTTEEREKMELFTLADKLGGDIELAIRQLAENKEKHEQLKFKDYV